MEKFGLSIYLTALKKEEVISYTVFLYVTSTITAFIDKRIIKIGTPSKKLQGNTKNNIENTVEFFFF